MSGLFDESLNPENDRYLESLLPRRAGVLAEMEKYALDRDFPFIGPLAGRLIEVVAGLCGAKTVFELGSGFGYSAMHFALALPEDGRVVCTDNDPENEKLATDFFRRAGLLHKLEFKVGDAHEILKLYDGPFDVIFMDCDKQGYGSGVRAAWPKLKPGGVFIADNMFRNGQVPAGDMSPASQGVRDFTRFVHSQPDALTTIVPTRDGVSVTYKLK
jgi:caffeoyl-CoA O-methyltransferase